MRPIFLGLLLAAAALPAQAEETTKYQIELIIFENLDAATRGTEVWQKDPGVPDLSDAVQLTPEESASPVSSPAIPAEGDPPTPTTASTPVTQARDLVLLPQQKLKLTSLMQKMQSSGKYRPLLHVGWSQNLTDTGQTMPVRIFSGMHKESAAGSELRHPLDGTVKVSRGRYLHVDADLIFFKKGDVPPGASVAPAEPSSTETPVESMPPMLAHRLVESRRTRSNELQYLDHPLFGMVVSISPIETKKAKRILQENPRKK